MCPCTSFRYGGLSELLSSAGSTGSGNTSNYEDIYNFGLFKYSSAKVLCRGLGCNAIPLVNAPLDWIVERELRLVWRLFLQSSVSATLLAFYLCIHHWPQ